MGHEDSELQELQEFRDGQLAIELVRNVALYVRLGWDDDDFKDMLLDLERRCGEHETGVLLRGCLRTLAQIPPELAARRGEWYRAGVPRCPSCGSYEVDVEVPCATAEDYDRGFGLGRDPWDHWDRFRCRSCGNEPNLRYLSIGESPPDWRCPWPSWPENGPPARHVLDDFGPAPRQSTSRDLRPYRDGRRSLVLDDGGLDYDDQTRRRRAALKGETP